MLIGHLRGSIHVCGWLWFCVSGERERGCPPIHTGGRRIDQRGTLGELNMFTTFSTDNQLATEDTQ